MAHMSNYPYSYCFSFLIGWLFYFIYCAEESLSSKLQITAILLVMTSVMRKMLKIQSNNKCDSITSDLIMYVCGNLRVISK